MEDEEGETAEFHQTYSASYGYNGTIDTFREKEFKRLGDELLLDHIGATQYPQSLLDRYFSDLSKNIYSNPHSHNPSSQLTTEYINEIRNQILLHFNTNSDEYTVVFTSGATASMKLVAECFEWQENSSLYFLQNSHTSVVGIREYAIRHGASIVCIPDKELQSTDLRNHFQNIQIKDHNCSSLFVFPAMCNMSGKKYPLELIASMHDLDMPGRWYVMVDAASFVSTSYLDLKKYKADFVPVSFYKMFGFPTGIGALLIRNKSANVLKKVYYGGGTVLATISSEQFHVLRPNISERFEDGTLPFLDIIAVGHALENLHHLTGGMQAICDHTFSLAQFVYNKMNAMRHFNGSRVCQLYCGTGFTNAAVQGPVINFNLLRSNGAMIGYGEVDKFACLFNIHLRTGSFCNTGASQEYLEISNTQLKNNYLAGHVCGDSIDLIDGLPTGSVRISFGYMSTFSEAQRFLKFVKYCFVENGSGVTLKTLGVTKQDVSKQNVFGGVPLKQSDGESVKLPTSVTTDDQQSDGKSLGCFTLKKICLYPIKSCGAFEVSRWPIGPRGFMFDRQWMIINDSHICLSQKREPKLCLIRPSVDEKSGIIKVDGPDMPTLEVKIIDSHSTENSSTCRAKVNQEWLPEVFDCGDDAANWMTSFLGKKCRLVQQKPDDYRKSKVMQAGCKETYSQSSLSLANVSQYLLISQASASIIHINQESKDSDLDRLVSRFRGNLIIDGNKPFVEDEWKTVLIGHHSFQFQGLCSRCQMICLDQQTGERSAEPLKTLGLVRGTKIGTFGIGLVHTERDCTGCSNDNTQQQYLQAGDAVHIIA